MSLLAWIWTKRRLGGSTTLLCSSCLILLLSWLRISQGFPASISLGGGGSLDEDTNDHLAKAPLVWKANMSTSCVAAPALSPDSSLVLIGCNDHHLYALYTQNGTSAWDRVLSGRIQASVLMSEEGIAYIGSDSGEVLALDSATGALQWRRSLNNAIKGSAAFSTSSSSQQNLLIVPAGPLIVLLDAKEGYIIAHVELAGDIETTPAVQGQMIFVASTDTVLYAIDISNPVEPFIAWKYETGQHIDFQSSPALSVDGSTVYIGGYSRRLHAVDTQTGQARWTFHANDTVATASVSEDDGTIFVGSSDRHLYAIEPNNGTLRWSYRTPSAIQSRPGIGPRRPQDIKADPLVSFGGGIGRVPEHHRHHYRAQQLQLQKQQKQKQQKLLTVGTSGKHVYGLGLDTGRPVWSFLTDGWVVSSPVQGPDCSIVFGSLDHHVYRIGNCEDFASSSSVSRHGSMRDEL